MSKEFSQQLDQTYTGKWKKMAQEVAEAGGKPYSGKAAFSHEIYIKLCGVFFEGPAEYQFAGLFSHLHGSHVQGQ